MYFYLKTISVELVGTVWGKTAPPPHPFSIEITFVSTVHSPLVNSNPTLNGGKWASIWLCPRLALKFAILSKISFRVQLQQLLAHTIHFKYFSSLKSLVFLIFKSTGGKNWVRVWKQKQLSEAKKYAGETTMPVVVYTQSGQKKTKTQKTQNHTPLHTKPTH